MNIGGVHIVERSLPSLGADHRQKDEKSPWREGAGRSKPLSRRATRGLRPDEGAPSPAPGLRGATRRVRKGPGRVGDEAGDARAKLLRGVPHRSRHRIEHSRHPVQERFDRARTGQMESHAVLILLDLCCDFAQRQPHRRGLRLGHCGMGQRVETPGMVEDIRRTGQEQAHGGGQTGGGGGESTAQVMCEGLQGVFAVASRAVQVFIQQLGCGRFERGHDTARMVILAHHFGLEYHPPGLLPGGCAVAQRILDAPAARRGRALGLGDCEPVGVQLVGLSQRRSCVALEHAVCREAKDAIGQRVLGNQVPQLGRGAVTLAAHQEVRVGPVLAQMGQEAGDNHGVFRPLGAYTGAQAGGHQGL
jgi:hypothetical protein